MKNSKYLILFTIIFFFICQQVKSESISILEIGAVGGISYNDHQVWFMDLPGFTNCCSFFESNSDYGYTAGISGRLRFSNNIDIQLKLMYLPTTTELRSREFIGNQELNGELTHIYSNHQLQPNLGLISLLPSIIFYPFSNSGLFLSAGISLGTFIKKDAIQREFLDTDIFSKGIGFSDGSSNLGQYRNIISGEIPVNNIIFSIVPSIGYKFNLSGNYSISLQLDYNNRITRVVPKKEWIYKNIEFSLNFSYSIISSEQIDIKKPIEHDFLFPEKVSNYLTNLSSFQKEELPQIKELLDIYLTKMNYQDECYYIIFASNENEIEINRVLDLFKDNNLENVKISYFNDNEDNTVFYRLRSECFNDIEQTFKYLDSIKQKIEYLGVITNYYLKLGE